MTLALYFIALWLFFIAFGIYEDPEEVRPKGRWVRPTKINGRTFDIPHCSACEGVPCGVDENTHYCPNCGALMKGENNE